MPMAARQGDNTVHGGVIMIGLPTVLIEGQPAARVGDMHVCPMATPGTPPIPHVGGPILPPGAPTVLVGGQPAARVGDWCTCVAPIPIDTILRGAVRTQIGMAALVPPAPPSGTTPGTPGGSEAYLVNYQWVTNWVAGVNAGVGWNVGAVVSIAAGAVGAVAVGLVVWVAVVKVRMWEAARDSRERFAAQGPLGPHIESFPTDHGVRDDAPVYFL
jgi:uncharacterized Zn-binding protein involved in type VI secretion